MIINAEEDKKNWQWLPIEYGQRLDAIREACQGIWNECQVKPQLVNYTPHGPSHSNSVEDNIHRLIPKASFLILTERERFYLLASASVHDLGNMRGILEGDNILSDEEIRTNHHLRSERFIVNNFIRLNCEQLDAHVLGLMAYFHRRHVDIQNCPEYFSIGTETVRLRILAAYLRLADSLDITESRSPASQYAICLAYNIPMSSKLHWIKSRMISGIEILPERHQIIIDFKKPRDEDFAEYLQRTNNQNEPSTPKEYRQNLELIYKAVIDDLRDELDTVKSVLIRSNITYYLDIVKRVNQMTIDAQVMPEINRLVHNFEMMAHPSASKWIQIVLNTLKDILAPYRRDCPDENGRPMSLPSEATKGKGIPKNVEAILKEFLAELRQEMDTNRPCHLGIHNIIEKIDSQLKQNDIDALQAMVMQNLNGIEFERQSVRDQGFHFFKKWQKDHATHADTDLFKETINIMVYGYSELVIKALCGFRDVQIKELFSTLHKEPDSPWYGEKKAIIIPPAAHLYKNNDNENQTNVDLKPKQETIHNYYHDIDLEAKASDHFHIFVCEGQPKTITAHNDALVYHDGSRYALELKKRAFTNITIIPDLIAGTLLAQREADRRIHFVMLGANGLQSKAIDEHNTQEVFLHSSGHLAIANLVQHQRHLANNSFYPRLVLVLSHSKYKPIIPLYERDKSQKTIPTKQNLHDTSKPFMINGMLFWIPDGKESIRPSSFFARDEQVRQALLKAGVNFYNPREDSVELDKVDDIITDINIISDFRKDEMKKKIFLTQLKRGTIEDHQETNSPSPQETNQEHKKNKK